MGPLNEPDREPRPDPSAARAGPDPLPDPPGEDDDHLFGVHGWTDEDGYFHRYG